MVTANLLCIEMQNPYITSCTIHNILETLDCTGEGPALTNTDRHWSLENSLQHYHKINDE